MGGDGHGHKGSALAVMVDILGGVLSGTGPSFGVDVSRRPYFNNGTFFFCIDPTVFRNYDSFLADVELLKHNVKSAQPRMAGQAVYMPGEPELIIEKRRRREGIPVPGRTWHGFTKLSKKLGVKLPQSLEEKGRMAASPKL